MSLNFDLERIRGGLARIQPENSHSQFIVDMRMLVAEIDRLEHERSQMRPVTDVARAFVEWHLTGPPKLSGTLSPSTCAEQEAWHEEWYRRMDALIAAVAASA